MSDLTIVIPARNEMFLSRTVQDIIQHMEGDTEIIAIIDGDLENSLRNDPIPNHPRVTVVTHNTSVGQREATNEGCRMATSKYIMKADGHCSFDQGFDKKLMEHCEYDWTVIPVMKNLHAFNWRCMTCGAETYQGPTPTQCNTCQSNSILFERKMIWQPRSGTSNLFMRFDRDLHFQYWGGFKERPEVRAQKDYVEVMSLIGACFFMHRERYFELDGMDNRHGGWGQMGTEVACKAWLSGGKLIGCRKTWFAHMFRTQGGDFSFPYNISGHAVGVARKHSKDVWYNNKWPKQIYPLGWMIQKFWPIPEWDDTDLAKQLERDKSFKPAPLKIKFTESKDVNCIPSQPPILFKPEIIPAGTGDSNYYIQKGQEDWRQPPPEPSESVFMKLPCRDDGISLNPGIKTAFLEPKLELTKGMVYYTDNLVDAKIGLACQRQIQRIALERDMQIVCVSLKTMPIQFAHKNFVLPLERGILTMTQQILKGLEESDADIIYFVEHDLVYHPSHFDFIPPLDNAYYYNENTWKVRSSDGQCVFFHTKQTSGCVAYRRTLLTHYRERIRRIESEGFSRSMGFEPGCHHLPNGVDNLPAKEFMSKYPNVDIRHANNLTWSRFKPEQYRSQKSIRGWTLANDVPYWGLMKGHFDEFLDRVINGDYK